MRTFAPDHRFVIGSDPRLSGLYWAAGLGGHGMTCAPAVGELTAQWLIEGGSDHPAAAVLAPSRLFP
jgi:glycine/D-amino acid oxidase-like deaminating enzyme